MGELAIRVQGLHKAYPGVKAVDGLDLDVATGEVFGLLGPNGAGKTTTLEILEGLTPADAGTVELLGRTWKTGGAELRTRIGVQLQSTSLYQKITPREALEIFGAYYPRRRPAQELLERVGLTEKADATVSNLSGGQQQRLALALALVNDPELVFLDEPTTGLDPQARRALWDVVRSMQREGRTILITTHYMDEAEVLCDRIAILDHGRILQQGSPRSLVQSLGIPSVVELAFPEPEALPEGLAADLGLEVHPQGACWELPTRDPKTDLPRILEAAERLGLPYDQVHVRRASLEDLFLHLTGRSLRD
mgnify:CR=1 FL=1